MGAVDVEGAATVTRHQLDRFPRGHGAAKNGLTSAASQGRDVLRAMQIVDHPEREQDQCDGDRQRNEDAHHGSHQVDPEVADLLASVLRKSSDQRHSDTHPNCAADERLNAQSGEQPDMPECGFAGVVLPTGVGDERDCGVERQRGRHTPVPPRLRQPRLH